MLRRLLAWLATPLYPPAGKRIPAAKPVLPPRPMSSEAARPSPPLTALEAGHTSARVEQPTPPISAESTRVIPLRRDDRVPETTTAVTAVTLVTAPERPAVEARTGADWRGPGYFVRGWYTMRSGSAPRFQPPIEIVRGQLDRFRGHRLLVLPTATREPPAPLPVSATIPFDFLPVLPAFPEQRMELVPALDPRLFTAFLLDRERSGPTADLYLRWPPVLRAAESLLQEVLTTAASHSSKLSIDALFSKALARIGDPPSALLVCHNVTKALARGSETLGLRRIDPERHLWEYRGVRIVLASSAGQPFFQFFDKRDLGSVDAGAWYRFFGLATATAFCARGLLIISTTPSNQPPAVAQVDAIARAIVAAEPESTLVGPRAWANALAFREWAVHGRSADQVAIAMAQATRAFCFGLGAAGASLAGPVRWLVPAPKLARDDLPAPLWAGLPREIAELPPC